MDKGVAPERRDRNVVLVGPPVGDPHVPSDRRPIPPYVIGPEPLLSRSDAFRRQLSAKTVNTCGIATATANFCSLNAASATPTSAGARAIAEYIVQRIGLAYPVCGLTHDHYQLDG